MNLLIIIVVLSIIIMICSIVCVSTKKEQFANYPFSPIPPSLVVPTSLPSVYSMEGDNFQLATSEQDASLGAWKTLKVVEAQQNLGNNLNIDWKANSRHQPNVGAGYLLTLADPPNNFWQNL